MVNYKRYRKLEMVIQNVLATNVDNLRLKVISPRKSGFRFMGLDAAITASDYLYLYVEERGWSNSFNDPLF